MAEQIGVLEGREERLPDARKPKAVNDISALWR
jgi:hypothetical protein